MPADTSLLSGQPIPLRMVPFITGWPLDLLAVTLMDTTTIGFPYFTPLEWIDNQQQRRVSIETMQELLTGLKGEQDRRTGISILPPKLFIWSDDLTHGFHRIFVNLYTDENFPYSLDWEPSIHLYEDLIAECPDFSPAPSKQELRKQATVRSHAELSEKAVRLRAQHPDKSEQWIAKRLHRSGEAEGFAEETIRKIIRI